MIRAKIRELLIVMSLLGTIIGVLFIFGAGIVGLYTLCWWAPVSVVVGVIACALVFWFCKYPAF